MKKATLYLITALMLLVGCTSYSELPAPSIGTINGTAPVSVLQPEPLGPEPRITVWEIGVTDTDMDRIYLSPAYMEFANLSPTSRVDTWTSQGFLKLGPNTVTYDRGDPVYFIVHNDSARTKRFRVEVANAPETVNPCSATGQSYFQAPEPLSSIVTVSSSDVILAAGEAAKIDIVIQLVDSLEYPSQWEFRLNLVPLDTGYNVAGGVRVFVYMR